MLTVPGVLQTDRHGKPCAAHALYFLFIRKGFVLIAFPAGSNHKRIEGLHIELRVLSTRSALRVWQDYDAKVDRAPVLAAFLIVKQLINVKHCQ